MSELCGVPLGEMRRDRQTPAAQVVGVAAVWGAWEEQAGPDWER